MEDVILQLSQNVNSLLSGSPDSNKNVVRNLTIDCTDGTIFYSLLKLIAGFKEDEKFTMNK